MGGGGGGELTSTPEVGVADWKHGRLPGGEPRFNVVRLPIILWDVLVFLMHGNIQRVTTTHRITTCPSESQRVGAAPCGPETEREARQRVQVSGGVNRVVGVAVVGQDLLRKFMVGTFFSSSHAPFLRISYFRNCIAVSCLGGRCVVWARKIHERYMHGEPTTCANIPVKEFLIPSSSSFSVTMSHPSERS